MKKLFLFILTIFLFVGCTQENEVTKESCQKLGKAFKTKKILNFRTGEYENRGECF